MSYYKFNSSDNLSIETIVVDVYLFIKYLLNRFNQDKLIQQYPDLISKYIGIGQVVNMRKNIDFQKSFLNEKGLTEININLEDEESIIKDSLPLQN